MTIYLTIMVTVLVVTQVIRLVQNCLQLRKHAQTDRMNERIGKQWQELTIAINVLNDTIAGKEKCE